MLAGGTKNIAPVDASFRRGQTSPLHWSDRYQQRESRALSEATARPHLATTRQTRRHGPPWPWRRLHGESKSECRLSLAYF